jgi:hypothetical protein
LWCPILSDQSHLSVHIYPYTSFRTHSDILHQYLRAVREGTVAHTTPMTRGAAPPSALMAVGLGLTRCRTRHQRALPSSSWQHGRAHTRGPPLAAPPPTSTAVRRSKAEPLGLLEQCVLPWHAARCEVHMRCLVLSDLSHQFVHIQTSLSSASWQDGRALTRTRHP